MLLIVDNSLKYVEIEHCLIIFLSIKDEFISKTPIIDNVSRETFTEPTTQKQLK